jgi:hypothetical protein
MKSMQEKNPAYKIGNLRIGFLRGKVKCEKQKIETKI